MKKNIRLNSRRVSMKEYGQMPSTDNREITHDPGSTDRYSQITQRIDYPNYITNKSAVNVNKTVCVNWSNVKPGRAGVIVYTDVILKNKTSARYFFLGEDTATGELTDFGGGVQYKSGESIIQAALRELAEESLCCFGKITKESIDESTVVYDNNMAIFFIPVNVDRHSVIHDFHNTVLYAFRPEVKGIVAASRSMFYKFVNGDTVYIGDKQYELYSRVRKLLSSSNIQKYI